MKANKEKKPIFTLIKNEKKLIPEFSPQQKTAILLSSLGPQVTRTLLAHLKDHEVRRLVELMGQVNKVPIPIVKEVLADFYQALNEQHEVIFEENQQSQFLQQILDPERREKLWGKEGPQRSQPTLDSLEMVDDLHLRNFLSRERPSTTSVILIHLAPTRRAKLFASLPVPLQDEVLICMARLSDISPLYLQQLNEIIKTELVPLGQSQKQKRGGPSDVVEMLHLLDKTQQETLMRDLQLKDPELADEIRQKLVVFDDLLFVDDVGLRLLLKDIPVNTWILSMKLAKAELRQKLTQQMSKRNAQMFAEDLAALGPTPKSTVEKAQKEIADKMKELLSEGRLRLSRQGSEDPLV